LNNSEWQVGMDLEGGGFCVFEKCNWNMHREAEEGHKIHQLG
jgi:hypothetical protein